ncbi:MAG: cytochrome C oxidase subunit IV family protein [Planctomycetes bacterium]|nr:cytochrome C oxidase subunit IV family protein [Planctomycetota bacterium]
MSTHTHTPHVLPLRVYWGVFTVLVFGTLITVWSATKDLGALNMPIALAIAVTKAAFVILYFMHVKYSTKLTWLFVMAGFLWFIIMVVITMADYTSRTWL